MGASMKISSRKQVAQAQLSLLAARPVSGDSREPEAAEGQHAKTQTDAPQLRAFASSRETELPAARPPSGGLRSDAEPGPSAYTEPYPILDAAALSEVACEAPGSRHGPEGDISGAGGPRPQADAMTLYALARQVKDDAQGAMDYAARGPRQDLQRARQLLARVRDALEGVSLLDRTNVRPSSSLPPVEGGD